MTAPQPLLKPSLAALPNRVVSVDVLRGLTVMLMILVNNSGQRAYWPLHHAEWNGWTPTDMVFPTFLFLMGSAIVFSFRHRMPSEGAPPLVGWHILRRFVILCLLGLLVNTFPYFQMDTMRFFGVLQRIAVCYLVVSLLVLANPKPRVRIAAIVVVLLAYWALMRLVPVPGLGLPVRDIPLLDPDHNLAAWLDRMVVPARRLYERTRDPEGLLSTLPAFATTMLGTLTGEWLLSNRNKAQKTIGMFVAGIAGFALAELWSPWFPINKKLWTSSYVLLAAGWSLVFLAICYWAVEIKGWKKGWTYPAVVFGSNAIVAYVFSELLGPLVGMSFAYHGHKTSIGRWVNGALAGLHTSAAFAALLYSLLYVAVCFVPVLLLYRRKLFIKI